MNYTDSTHKTIKQLEEKVAFLERCISKLEQKIWSGSGLVDRIETLEEKNDRFRADVEEAIDHVQYEAEEQLIKWKNNFRERIESLEQKVWKKEVEIDHVRYEVDEQLRADAEEAGVGSIVDMMEDVGKCVSDYLEDKNENDK